MKKRKVSDIPIIRRKSTIPHAGLGIASHEEYISQPETEPEPEYVHASIDGCDATVDVVETEPIATPFEAAPLKTSALKLSKNAKKASSFLPKFEKEEKETKDMDISKPLTKNNHQDWKDIQKGFSGNESGIQGGAVIDINIVNQDILESDGSLNLFWIDAFEKKGRVFLFGKVRKSMY